MKLLKNLRRWLPIAVLVGLSSACLYTNTYAPNAYRSATPIDVKATGADPLVEAQACTYSVLWLVSWGNSGYAKATTMALKNNPESVLYDVKSDIRVTAYLLGLYSRVCTIVSGRAGHV